MSESESYAQLQMVWPEHLLSSPPAVRLPPGYSLRTYRPGDEPRFYEIMELAAWPGWNDDVLLPWLARIPPDCWFMAVHEETDQIVATAMGLHDHSELHPFGGEQGWLAGDPAHAGKGLGMALCAAVTARLIEAGYRNIHLYTEDWRLAALKTYLKVGYIPFLYTPEMAERWRAVCAQLQWPFTPEVWTSQTSQRVEEALSPPRWDEERGTRKWSKHALLLIDVQNDFLRDAKDFPSFQDNITALLAFARRNGIRIIHMRVTFKPDKSDWMVVMKGADSVPALEGTYGAEVAPFAREMPNERVFIKHKMDAFIGTRLDDYLRAKRIKHVMCAGLVTPICVLITALSAMQRGFLTTILSDCCASNKEHHEFVLKLYSDFVSDVIPFGEIEGRYSHWEEQIEAAVSW